MGRDPGAANGPALLNLDKYFFNWNTNLLGDRGPNVDLFGIGFDADHQCISGTEPAAVPFGLIFPPSGDGIYADPAPFGQVSGRSNPDV